MTKLTALPSLEIIRGFKGVIDFYVRRGTPCARRWPRYRPAKRTAASIAASLLFGQIIGAYRLLADEALAFFVEDSLDQPRTPRDIYVSAVLGHLHEASMSDFLTLLTECRNSLLALEALLGSLDSVDTDEIVVNVDQSVLPTGAATAAHQVTQNTALATIAKLEEALKSVATDRLLVTGAAQLENYSDVLAYVFSSAISGANGYADSYPVPAGSLWKVTAVAAFDSTSATTAITMKHRHNGTDFIFHEQVKALAEDESCTWAGQLYLDPLDVIRVYFKGGLPGDWCYVYVLGKKMIKEA